MYLTKTQEGFSKTSASGNGAPALSPALEWIWGYLQDIRNPHALDCGPAASSTINVLLRRGAKIYVADLIAPLQRSDPSYWRRVGKEQIFCLDEFLTLIPTIPPASLALVCAWHLLDLVPRDHLTGLVSSLFSLLEPGGLFFCFLRESNLDVGMEGRWKLESLTTLGAESEGKGRFPYPPLSNREVERLAQGSSVKTFLTRSHRREIVFMKEGGV